MRDIVRGQKNYFGLRDFFKLYFSRWKTFVLVQIIGILFYARNIVPELECICVFSRSLPNTDRLPNSYQSPQQISIITSFFVYQLLTSYLICDVAQRCSPRLRRAVLCESLEAKPSLKCVRVRDFLSHSLWDRLNSCAFHTHQHQLQQQQQKTPSSWPLPYAQSSRQPARAHFEKHVKQPVRLLLHSSLPLAPSLPPRGASFWPRNQMWERAAHSRCVAHIRRRECLRRRGLCAKLFRCLWRVRAWKQ